MCSFRTENLKTEFHHSIPFRLLLKRPMQRSLYPIIHDVRKIVIIHLRKKYHDGKRIERLTSSKHVGDTRGGIIDNTFVCDFLAHLPIRLKTNYRPRTSNTPTFLIVAHSQDNYFRSSPSEIDPLLLLPLPANGVTPSSLSSNLMAPAGQSESPPSAVGMAAIRRLY